VENERLQQYIRALRAHSQQLSAGQVVQHLGPYAGDDVSAQLAANLGLPARLTHSGDSSRPHYSSISHGYEASSFPAITVVEDDGDSEPRRKKANFLVTRSAYGTNILYFPSSSKNHSVASSIYAILAVALIPRNGERWTYHLCLGTCLLITLL
jgi:hypothetical protein